MAVWDRVSGTGYGNEQGAYVKSRPICLDRSGMSGNFRRIARAQSRCDFPDALFLLARADLDRYQASSACLSIRVGEKL